MLFLAYLGFSLAFLNAGVLCCFGLQWLENRKRAKNEK